METTPDGSGAVAGASLMARLARCGNAESRRMLGRADVVLRTTT
jgi:hypothetical protein